MIKERELQLFKSIHQGEYSSVPKPLYNLLVLVANNLNQETLVVRCSERPRVIETIISNYDFKGIATELERDIYKFESLFTRTYKITIIPRIFLSDIQVFNQMTKGNMDNSVLYRQLLDVEKLGAKQKQEKKKERILYKSKKDDCKEQS